MIPVQSIAILLTCSIQTIRIKFVNKFYQKTIYYFAPRNEKRRLIVTIQYNILNFKLIINAKIIELKF